MDFCANDPCPDGHRCIDHGDDFTCECPGGRNGPDCNQVPRTVSSSLYLSLSLGKWKGGKNRFENFSLGHGSVTRCAHTHTSRGGVPKFGHFLRDVFWLNQKILVCSLHENWSDGYASLDEWMKKKHLSVSFALTLSKFESIFVLTRSDINNS